MFLWHYIFGVMKEICFFFCFVFLNAASSSGFGDHCKKCKVDYYSATYWKPTIVMSADGYFTPETMFLISRSKIRGESIEVSSENSLL